VIDEFRRECPAIVVGRFIAADRVVALLERLVAQRGAPGFLRFDNGPEFIAHAVADWCRFNDVATVFIDPGSPWQNAWIESFNGRLRDELLNGRQFDSSARSPSDHRGLTHRRQRAPSSQRPQRSNAHRIRPGLDHPPTPSRITPGPPIGSPSRRSLPSPATDMPPGVRTCQC
jgi:putative transposase